MNGDVLFKEGKNGNTYLKCNVVYCDFWSHSPMEMAKHMINVHGRNLDRMGDMVKKYLKFKKRVSGGIVFEDKIKH